MIQNNNCKIISYIDSQAGLSACCLAERSQSAQDICIRTFQAQIQGLDSELATGSLALSWPNEPYVSIFRARGRSSATPTEIKGEPYLTWADLAHPAIHSAGSNWALDDPQSPFAGWWRLLPSG